MNTSRSVLRPLLVTLALALAVVVAPAFAKDPVFAAVDGAIRGYDPVAYHEQQKPVKGSADHALQWQGAEWYFASAESRDKFQQDPERYAPQYGGYCAFAVANGATATTDPDAWSIADGKLYLNYSLDVREKWRGDIPGYIDKANANWPGVLN